ncbi:hypothetical protein Tco_1035744 [Tanacetum coccineum]
MLTLYEVMTVVMTTGSSDGMKVSHGMLHDRKRCQSLQVIQLALVDCFLDLFLEFFTGVCVMLVVVVKPIELHFVLSVAVWKWEWPVLEVSSPLRHLAFNFFPLMNSLANSRHSFQVFDGLRPSSSKNRPLIIPRYEGADQLLIIEAWDLHGFVIETLSEVFK